MAIEFDKIGEIKGVDGGSNVLTNPTSLQFGPDGRLYVSEQNGTINAFTIDIVNGEYVATDHEVLKFGTRVDNGNGPEGTGAEVVKSIINHDDDGSINTSVTNRQVTGLVVTGTSDEPIIYLTSSDPRVPNSVDSGLDTNSGILTRLSLNNTTNEWEAVDLIRGFPRSEENHSTNGLTLSADGTKLFLQVGGNTNNGAPSKFFAFTSEYTLSGALLEIDLDALSALENAPGGLKTDPNAGQNGLSRDYVYDLPTLNDLTVVDGSTAANGAQEDINGLDTKGPWGGNDGFNMAIIPADAPLRIYADGFRNQYDIVLTEAGKLYTLDNGGNGGLGDDPVFVNGEVTDGYTGIGGGGNGDDEPLFLIEEGGNYGHPAPVRANQDMTFYMYDDNGNIIDTITDISQLIPNGIAMPNGFIIDPSKFAAAPGKSLQDLIDEDIANGTTTAQDRLLESATRVDRDSNASNNIGLLTASSNGMTEYTGDSFEGALKGDLLIASFDGNVYRADLSADGTSLLNVQSNGKFNQNDNKVISGLTQPLDVTIGPDGETVWVVERSAGQISVWNPDDAPAPPDFDFDDDGIDDKDDPFFRDASNGQQLKILPGETLTFDFVGDATPAPGPSTAFPGGLTGVMINGTQNLIDDLNNNLDNVKFETAAGGGTTQIETVSNGDPTGATDTGEFLFHTGVSLSQATGVTYDDVTIKWVLFNPGLSQSQGDGGLTGADQQLGAYIGTGDQENYLKIVAGPSNNGEIIVELENNNATVTSQSYVLQANDLFAGQPLGTNKITIELTIDPTAETATPTITYDLPTGGTNSVTGAAVSLTGTNILSVIDGTYQVQGQTSGLAVGLYSSNVNEAEANAFTATFDEIEITANGDAPETQVLYRVNAGGVEVAAIDDGPAWSADTQQNNSPFLIDAGSNNDFPTSGNPTTSPINTSLLTGFAVPEDVLGIERWDNNNPNNGTMKWAFDVAAGTDVEVRLYFAELFTTISDTDSSGDASGDRVFDVSVDGVVPAAFQDIDPYALGGNAFFTGSVVTHNMVSDGTIDLEFLHNVENPAIKGIEIVQIGGSNDLPAVSIVSGDQTVNEGDGQVQISLLTDQTVPSDETVSITFEIVPNTAMPGAGNDYSYASGTAIFDSQTGVYTDTVQIAGSSSDVTFNINILQDTIDELDELFTVNITSVSSNAVIGTASSATITISDDDVSAGGEVLFRINTGGPLVTSIDDGPDWEADTNSNPSQFRIAGGESSFGSNTTILVDPNNTNNAPAVIFNTERFDFDNANSPDEMEYAFSGLSAGDYTINLYLAEGSADQSAPNARNFDVEIEGAVPTVFDDINLFVLGGSGNNGTGNNAFVLSHTQNVTDGTLNVKFLHDVVNNPAVRGIEIIQNGASDPVDSINGIPVLGDDLSSDAASPTVISLPAGGSTTVLSNLEGGHNDRDFFTVSIPEGYRLVDVILDSYDAEPSNLGFIGMIAGTDFVVDPAIPALGISPDGIVEPGDLLGGLTFGSGNVGDDLLPFMNNPGFFEGFDENALTGDLTFWLNQGGNPSSATLTFVTEAIPQVGVPGAYLPNENGDFVFEAESAIDPGAGGFEFKTTGDLPQGHDVPSGGGYVEATSNHFGNQNGETLTYKFTPEFDGFVRVNLVASYQGGNATEENDTWTKIELDGVGIPALDQSVPLVSNNGFYKTYSSGGNGLDFILANKNVDFNPQPIVVPVEAGKTYDFLLSERSAGHEVDRIVLEFFENEPSGIPNNGQANNFQNAPVSPQIPVVEVGEATLSVTVDSDNVQISNFGANSFQLTNTGTKTIEKVEIDVTNALYPDSVFDPFGVAGDTVSKLLTININGNTGVVTPSNASYVGAGGVSGFEGVILEFDENVNGGFGSGETVGFSVDMDPNSVAGATKSILDSGANPAWDIGGVSGAELIGSSFTITFTDGSAATGQLQGAGNQGGSKGIASQASEDLSVNLTVNGLNAGGVGVYDDNGPSVVINGPAGETARVVLTKGIIQPGDNNFSEPYKSQLDAQLAALAASDFPANNAAEFQTVDIVLTGVDQDISNLFDFTQVPNFDLAVNEAQVPLGFVASIIDPSNNDLPKGEVTTPIYLQFSENNEIDLELSKTVDNETPNIGDQITFTLTVDNVSDVNATGVQVEDLLPAGYSFVSALGNGTYDDSTGLWDVGSIDSGTSATLDITVTVVEAVTTPIITPLFRINAGGPEVAATDDGPAWSEDQSAVTANSAANLGTPSIYLVDRGLTGDDITYADNTPSGPGTNTTTAPDALFVTERYSALDNPNNLGYAFDVDNGTYLVDLFFDELFFTAAGNRVFDVEIEGVTVLQNYDPFAQNGNDSAVETFQTTVSDGELNIEFFKGSANNPNVAAIQISSLVEAGTPYDNYAQIIAADQTDIDSIVADDSVGDDDDATVSTTPITSADLELSKTVSDSGPAFGDTIVFTLTVNHTGGVDASGVSVQDLLPNGFTYVSDDSTGGYDAQTGIWTIGDLAEGSSASLNITATVNTPVIPPAETVLYRINVGGSEVAAADGSDTVWAVDTNANQSPFRVSGSNGTPSTGAAIDITDPSIPDSAAAQLFQSERFDQATGDPMKWEFPVAAGTVVDINLLFAETFTSITDADQSGDPTGDRIFDILIDGVLIFDDIDQYAIAGDFNKGFALTHQTTSDGVIDIEFLHTGVENTTVKAIEIIGFNEQTPVALNYTNYAEILTADQVDPDSVAGDNSVGDDDDATLIVEATDTGSNTLTITAILDAAEPATNGQFTVNLEDVAATDTIVAYTVTGTATSGVDYVALTGTVTIPTGATSAPIDVTVLDDLEIEALEDVIITLDQITSGDDNIAISTDISSNSASIALTDDDLANEVSVIATLDGAEADPLSTDGQFTVNVGTAVVEDTTIAYTITGTAVSGDDYQALSGEVTILAGQTSAPIDITVLDDLDVEGSETVVLTLDNVTAGDANIVIGANNIATVNIEDNDFPPAIIDTTISVSGTTTFGNSSFLVVNNASSTTKINKITFDIGTAVMSLGLDLDGEFLGSVWDPTAAAGDAGGQGILFTGANDVGFLADATTLATPGVQLTGPFHFSEQLTGGDNLPGGFQFMELNFTAFENDKSFVFGIDVDPQSIQGAVGTGEAGAVSGLEISGTTITVEFEDLTSGQIITKTQQLVPTGLNSSETTFTSTDPLPAPTLDIIGLTDINNRRVIDPNTSQDIEISGVSEGQVVKLFVFDASGYEKNGGNGTEIIPFDPFHANQIDGFSVGSNILTQTVGAGETSVTFNVDVAPNIIGAAPATVDDLYFFSAAIFDDQDNLISLLSNPAELKIGAARVMSIAGPGDVVESGDEGATGATFTLTLDDTSFNGEIDVDVKITPETGVDAGPVFTETIHYTFIDGVATLNNIGLADNDDIANGPDAYEFEITGATIVSGGTGAIEISSTQNIASGFVTEDDFAPVANPDFFSTPEKQTIFIPFATLLANDTDMELNDELKVVSIATPGLNEGEFFSDNGALITIAEEGVTALYGPPPGQNGVPFSGTDTFSYVIEDLAGNQATGQVTIEVTQPIVGDQGDVPTDDTLTGTNLSELFFGVFGNDTINALGGDDIIFGFVGDDIVNAGDGNDRVDGEQGDDDLFGGAGLDFLFGQEGEDELFGGDDTDALFGGDDDDMLFGEGGGDGLDGGLGNDTLVGGEGVDYLYGQEGDDILNGGEDLDALFGGVGSDTFVITSNSDEDQIFDWEDGIDEIDVSDITSNFNDLTIDQQGGNVLVGFGNLTDATVLIINEQEANITQDDFLF